MEGEEKRVGSAEEAGREVIRAAVLTISDSTARGEREDRSGPAVAAALTQLPGFEVTVREVLPDEVEEIAARLKALADGGEVDLILTTGGTGFTARDVTPEATRSILERDAPGLAERMRAESARITPLAALSRAVSGLRGRTLIINLPGSVRGAQENLQSIIRLLPHAVSLLREGK
jgi:molybdenum cofactor synthesis domain-containing protein